MIIGIDKYSIKYLDKIKSLGDNYIIYIFKDETLDELKKINIHSVHFSRIKRVDINFTKFDLRCLKKYSLNEINKLKEIKPKKNYKFCIIIPNYNNDHGSYKGKTFLENCIESVLNQTYKKFELIIVDDMSTDTSVETIKKYARKDNRITLIQNTRKRYNGGSRNVAIEIAQEHRLFDYYCFLDSDDWWKHDKVLEIINQELYGHELMLIGLELIDKNGVYMRKFHECDNDIDFFLSDSKVWCTAWSRVIRKDKIVYFPETTLMEDRNWSYEQADNVNFKKVKNLKEILYVWNRTNTTNSVSHKKGKLWEASAWCHIGHQLMLIEKLHHTKYKKLLKSRIETCKSLINNKEYIQY